MAKICFFIAYALTPDPVLQSAIRNTSIQLAADGHELIMGGMSGGNMELAGKTYLQAGGKAATIIYPEEYAAYEETFQHPNLAHVRMPNLHQRLEGMISTADAFIAFPGGMGTLHEIAQVIADNQACTYHTGTTRKVKPQVIFNYNGYFNSLIDQYDRAHAEGNIKSEHMELLRYTNNRADILPMIEKLLNQTA
ncbi:MAG: hypothetical protein EON60_01235 [Alphaproteobacteria bacterium]|nr:MAG: hypothetical protein EON60_01235 [Alphaproteobacteria bacterium]